MNKLIAIAAALFAIPAVFATSAEAGGRHGFNVFHNPAFHMIRKYHNNDHTPRRAKRRVKRKVYVAKKHHAKTVAKVEEKTEAPVKAAETENSSISTANGKVAAATETKTEAPAKVAAVEEIGCKKFFPSAGMTLSVPCE